MDLSQLRRPFGLLNLDDALMIMATKIVLPTVDIVTDIITIETVLSVVNPRPDNFFYIEDYNRIYIIGYAMIFFVVLSYLMIIPSYFRVEKTRKQRLKALPFLLVSSWPQYRGLRLLHWAYFDQNFDKLTYEKEMFDQDLSHLGK